MKHPPQTLFEAQVAFAGSLAVLWRVLAVISGAGLVTSLVMTELPLHDMLDADWALKDGKVDRSKHNHVHTAQRTTDVGVA